MSGLTDWLRSMQRREEDIREDERERIAADLDRRANGLEAYLADSDEELLDYVQIRTTMIALRNTAASLRGVREVNLREPDRAP